MSTTPRNPSTYAAPRQDLGRALEQFDVQADREGFVGPRIAPFIEVSESSGDYDVIPIASMLREYDTRRAPKSAYPRTGGEVEQDTFKTREYGMEEPVDDRLKAVHMSRFDAEMIAAERVRDAILRGHERRVITAALAADAARETDAADDGNDGDNGKQWGDPNADPFKLVRLVRAKVRSRVGRTPGCLVVSWEAFEKLAELGAINERVQYQYTGRVLPSDALLQPSVIAGALGVDELIVANSVTNAANIAEPAELETMWPADKALMMVKYDGQDTTRPQYMRTFHWAEDGSEPGGRFEEYREESIRGTVVRCRFDVDEKVVYAAAGEIITGLIV